MGLRSHRFRFEFWKTFLPRESAVPKSTSQLFVQKLNLNKKWRPIIFLTMAGVLSVSAYRVTAEEAKVTWLMSHRPHASLWQELLEKKSYVQVTDSETMDRLVTSIPYSSSSTAPRIWITENSRVIALLEPEERRIFTLGKGAPEKVPEGTWEPLGHGWEAYQSMTERRIPVLPAPQSHRKVRPAQSWDPRELRY